MGKEKFTKPALTIDQQIDLLQNRKLFIPNIDSAKHYLTFIGYYRIMGYGRHFLIDGLAAKPEFKPGISFEKILDLYIFDRELRLIILDALERIEIAVRTVISNYLSNNYNPHWFLEESLFLQNFKYHRLIETIKKDTGFCKNNMGGTSQVYQAYYRKYDDPQFPPSWMLTEGLSLGTWSQIYDFLKSNRDKREIAGHFKLHHKIFTSWLKAITYLRNLSAHHSIVCFRQYHIAPKKPHQFSLKFQEHFTNDKTLYPFLVVTNYLNNIVSPHSKWSDKLMRVIENHPGLPLKDMGFIPSWEKFKFE